MINMAQARFIVTYPIHFYIQFFLVILKEIKIGIVS
jgi:hypothetical protein